MKNLKVFLVSLVLISGTLFAKIEDRPISSIAAGIGGGALSAFAEAILVHDLSSNPALLHHALPYISGLLWVVEFVVRGVVLQDEEVTEYLLNSSSPEYASYLRNLSRSERISFKRSIDHMLEPYFRNLCLSSALSWASYYLTYNLLRQRGHALPQIRKDCCFYLLFFLLPTFEFFMYSHSLIKASYADT